MGKLAIGLTFAGLLTFLIASCGQGKSTTTPALSQQEVQEIQVMDSISEAIDNSMEELQASEEELRKALEDLN